MSEASRSGGGGFSLRSGWGLALIASLALNAFFLAHLAGSALWRERGEERAEKRGGRGGPIGSFIRERPEIRETAKALREARREEHRAARQAMRAARSAFREALTAEPYSAEKITAAQAQYRAARSQLGDVRETAMREFVEALTPEQRAAFAEHLARHSERRQRRREKDAP